MPLTINTNIASSNIDRRLNKAQNDVKTNFERLSSGKRINKASDDAAGLAIATQLLAQADTEAVASRNISDALSVTDVADGALETSSNIVTRISELAAQSANGTLSSDQRAAINQEVTQLTAELDRISQTTSFNGQQLLASDSSLSIQAGVTGDGSSNISVNLPGVSTSSLGLTGDVSTQDNARALLDAAKSATDRIASARAEIGGAQSRLSTAFENVKVSRENNLSSGSRILDADIAEESANLARNKILLNAGVSVKAQANLQPQAALRLLQG